MDSCTFIGLCPVLAMVVAAVSFWGGPAAAAAGERPLLIPFQEKVDWDACPSGYLAMGNRRLMHPVDVDDWPLKIDSKHQLFVDDYLVAHVENVQREFHPAAKHPANPILTAEKPWEQNGIVTVHKVMRDKATGKFRMWYNTFKPPGKNEHKGVGLRYPLCYAESDDGVKWTRPNLGIVEINGSRENNVIHTDPLMGLIHEPGGPDPRRRYKAFSYHRAWQLPVEGLYLYTSPDGIRWRRDSDRWIVPINEPKRTRRYRHPYRAVKHGLPGNGVHNANVHYDPVLKKYVADVKMRYAGKICVGRMESDDLIHWTQPVVTMYPDRQDPPDTEIYYVYTFPYESMWLGLLRVKRRKPAGWKQCHMQLVSSRDGRTWSRAGNRLPLIPLGDADSWEADYTGCQGPTILDDEIRFYYFSSRYYKRDFDGPQKPGGRYPRRAIGLATLRRDGFVSINATDKAGTIETRPLAYDGRKLFVNAEVSEGGSIRVALRDMDGKGIEGYDLGACAPLRQDTLRGAMTWRQSDDLPGDSGGGIEKHYRLLFELKQAKLYSFWIE